MNRTEQQWNKIQEQLKELRKQNQQLKRLLQLQIHQEPKFKVPRQFQSTKQNENTFQSENRQVMENSKKISQLKKQWAEWSSRLQASIVSKYNRVRYNTEMQDLRKTTNLSGVSERSSGGDVFFSKKSIKSKNSEQFISIDINTPGKSELIYSELVLDQKLSLIQDIFLFGPSVSTIQNAQQRKFFANHQLYYPQSQKEDFEVYGNYLFPNQLEVKHIREKNHGVEVNKMIFKNNKKLDCNIFIFQGQHGNQKLKKSNPILDKVNPSKWMYALSIQFSDFVSVNNQKISSSKINRTCTMSQYNYDKNYRYFEGDIIAEKQQKVDGTAKKNVRSTNEEQIFKSNFCLCIMTYFPFISFLKDILIEVFDSVKLRRMNKYNNCGEAFKQIDIYFFIEELKEELSKFLDDKLKVQAEINKVYNFPLNQVLMKLDLRENNLVNQVIADWGFKILKMLDKQSLLDIFCYMMMQESICFLSEDRNILTFVILLYVMVFSLPFGYPHPCVSIIFNQELLQTPFTAVLGINKSTKWLEQNLQNLTQNKQNKLIVNLNEQQVKIKFKKRPRTHKSQRLKKIFTSFYRKIQTSAIPSIFKKKIQLSSRQTTKEDNQHVSQMFCQLNAYYQEELLGHLPNRQIIDLIKGGLANSNDGEQEDSTKIYQIVMEKVEKYLWESRKNKCKDHKDIFIDELIKKQLFRVYIDRYYSMQ